MGFTGKTAYVLIGRETTFGTAVTCTKDLGLIQTVSINDVNGLRKHHAVGSLSTQAVVAGKFDATPRAEFLFQNGRIFEYALGTVTHAQEGTSSDWKHSFSENISSIPSFTMEIGQELGTTDAVHTYSGVKVGGVNVSINLEGSIICKADLLAKSVLTSSTTSAAVISTLPVLTDFHSTLKTGTLSSEATVSEVESFEFDIKNGTEKKYGLGSRVPTAVEAIKREMEFKFTAGFNTITEYTLFCGATSPSTASTPTIPSVIYNAHNGVTAGSGRRELYLKLGTCAYNSFGMPINMDGFIIQDFAGFATSIGDMYTYDNITSALWG